MDEQHSALHGFPGAGFVLFLSLKHKLVLLVGELSTSNPALQTSWTPSAPLHGFLLLFFFSRWPWLISTQPLHYFSQETFSVSPVFLGQHQAQLVFVCLVLLFKHPCPAHVSWCLAQYVCVVSSLSSLLEEERKADRMEERRKWKEIKEERGRATTEPFPSRLSPKHSVFLLFLSHFLHRNSKISKTTNQPCLSVHPQVDPRFWFYLLYVNMYIGCFSTPWLHKVPGISNPNCLNKK